MNISRPSVDQSTRARSKWLLQSLTIKASRFILLGLLALVALPAYAATDLLISTFTDSPDPAARGGTITYTIVASNNGSDPASNVTVTIPLPLTTTYEGATMSGGTCPAAGTVTAGNDIVCTLTGNLAGSGSNTNISLLVATTATTGNTINMSATAATSTAESNSGNNTSTQNTTINNGADLRLTSLNGTPDPVNGGSNITWAIAGGNQGPNDATNSTVKVTLPGSLSFVSGSGGGFSCSAAGQDVTCTGPVLANGDTFSGLNLVTKVTAGSGNAAITPLISSTVADPNPNNNSLTGSVAISPGADLQITQGTPSQSPAISNTDVTFSVQATNQGPSDATNGITVTYQLPAAFTFVSATPTGANWNACTVSGSNLVTCVNTGNYTVGLTDSISIVATAPTVTSVQTFNNIQATIAHNAGNPADPVSSNNTASINLNVSPNGAGLTLNKSRTPNPVAEGQNITSTIRVGNQGPLPASANTIEVTDTINTADENFVSFSTTTDWSCDNVVTPPNTLNPAATTVTCTYKNPLASGANATLTIITKSLVKGAAYTATNNAGVSCVAGSQCWFPGGQTTSANVSVTQATNSVDLAVTKTVSTTGGTNASLESNESTMTYTVVLRNNSTTVDAQDIVIRDPIPGYRSDTPSAAAATIIATNYTQGSTAAFTCAMDASQTTVLVCTQNSGVLKNGDTVTFTIPVSRNLNSGSFTNTATATSTTQGDTNTSNNSASVAVQIAPIADVEMVSKILTPSTTKAGTDATYVLTFRNNGPSQAANVSVTDTFTVAAADPGFTVISITPTNWTSGAPTCTGLTAGQSYGAGSTPTLTCTGTTLNSGEQRTVQIVVRPNWKSGQSADWTIPNTASITTSTAENINGTDGGNNSKTALLTVQAASVDLLINNNDNVDPLGYDASNSGNNAQNDVIYTINTVNNGPSLATGVRFTYAITPATGKTVRFLGDSAVAGPPSGSICNNIGSEVTGPNTLTISCVYTGTDSNLDNGASRNRYLSVRMLSTPASGGDIENSIATVFANETDSNSSNNTETETTTVRSDIAPNNLSLSGKVFIDPNDNGIQNTGEVGISGVTITLSGTTSTGVDVCTLITCTVQTAGDGSYIFTGLPTSNATGYRLVESQPSGYTDGKDQVGSLGSITPTRTAGTIINAGTDSFIVALTGAISGSGYNFGESTPAGGFASISGHVWLDNNHDRKFDTSTDTAQSGWIVELLLNNTLVTSTTTETSGNDIGSYSFTGLAPGTGYQVRFRNPNTGVLYGRPVTNEDANGNNPGSANTRDGTLNDITLAPGQDLVQQSLPLDPSGLVYNSVTRLPVAGAVVTISGPAGFDAATGLVGGIANQTQTTGIDGRYTFLLIPKVPVPGDQGAPDGVYTITVTSVPSGFAAAPSTIIPVCNTSVPLNVGSIPSVALVQQSASPPTTSVIDNPATCAVSTDSTFANGSGLVTTRYYFTFNLTSASSNVVNNNIPIDPILGGSVIVTKTTPLVNVTKGDLVPYTITVKNSLATVINVQDRIPPGFKYRTGSATVNGVAIEPTAAGRDLTWVNQSFTAGETKTYKLILIVGTGVGEGEYINQAWALNGATGTLLSNVAAATVRVTPDPTFDCSDIIGKVFDDQNANGYQDEGEPGIANVRVVTVRGLLVTTDPEGRFHVACADIPQADHGANFVMKLDERTLPSGYRLTTENPRDVRVTRGKMVKLNFGATVHRVVRLDLNGAAFAPNQTELLPEWQQALEGMPDRLASRPSVLRIAYNSGSDDPALCKKRLEAVAKKMDKLWKDKQKGGGANAPLYPLVIETAVEAQQ
ncbi:beta strand repeat-containing protein [Methyloradius palustris]|uniref:DUF11 domain-containing protein n=1 Tax=Methyloradius palustris TaxID=2778876 RepID=A0A8D5G6R7_9PROT|nr:SdrD B-like domain-containing protein [Methyloradius palustris]BCM24291.1 hypothetical protein ZMTM_05500 [Methyloradius palustris]